MRETRAQDKPLPLIVMTLLFAGKSKAATRGEAKPKGSPCRSPNPPDK